MNKKRLLQVLTALPEETPVTAAFCYGKTYSPDHESEIIGINMIENRDKTLKAVICAVLRKQEAAA